ncbi:uncharacterized protein LOC130741187 isoform X2 [Lotus japonicus]|uniref:uncharacterized protein LOC130741187 isoform X2 n=1 Tax=Lotus japonicus TaxID=34305 RepID=UPI002588B120|nr:uncharacterized protein LOC130741187 isoform X2 [Lotus japonicus]
MIGGQKIEASARKAMISKLRLVLCEGKVYNIALILISVQGATCEWETVSLCNGKDTWVLRMWEMCPISEPGKPFAVHLVLIDAE